MSGPPSASNQNMQGFETPRRQYTRGGQEDIEYGNMSSGEQRSNPYAPQGAQYAANQTPGLQFQQATPQLTSYSAAPPSGGLPDTLQPGASSRPPPATTVPSMHQGNPQQYLPPSRSAVLGSSHSHSRSSPAGMDQKYIPFSSTSSATPTSSSSKTFTPQTPSGSSSYSPLGLSDIRPRGASEYNHEITGPGAMFDYEAQASNSNYLAPWATYAYDWCKWPVPSGNSCGKMAIGSYLEDPHNFVRLSKCVA